jgi:hypothetical protein
MSIVVTSNGQFSAPLRDVFAFATPTVNGVLGCEAVDGNALATAGCHRNGTQLLTILGNNIVRAWFGCFGAGFWTRC